MRIDIVITEGEDGKALVHRPDCPMVREHREAGWMIATLFGVELPLPEDTHVHECLTEDEE